MKKYIRFLSLIFVAILLQSCGEVSDNDIKKVVLEQSRYLVKITVDLSDVADPVIYIYAREVNYDQNTETLLIKGGFIGSSHGLSSNSAIYIREATFQFKFPTSVTIKNLF